MGNRPFPSAAQAIVLTLLGLGLLASSAVASAPPGPRLATVELINTKGSERDEPTTAPFLALTTFGPSGQKQRHPLKQRFAEGHGLVPLPFSGPSWSGDGSLIAFVGSKGKANGIYVADADGGHLHLVKGTKRGRDPVIAPDGMTLAFSRSRTHFPKPTRHGIAGRFYSSTTTWIVNLGGGRARRLTNWRNDVDYRPESFSPDGSLLAMTKRDDRLNGPRIALLHVGGGEVTELEVPGEEATISPDGKQIAFAGYLDPTRIETEEDHDYDIGELYTMSLDGSQVKRLTYNSDKIESSPSWDPSGQRLAYVETKADTSFVAGLALLFPTGNAIETINVDGSCRKLVRSSEKVALYGAAWQPGAERGAGRIAC
jgi:Tol biopolymer transport system component